MASQIDQFKYDIFLSYISSDKRHVNKIYQKLKDLTFTVLLDDIERDNTQDAEGIESSHMILCCISKEYSESKSCINQFLYAKLVNIPLIVIMLEDIDIIEPEVRMEIGRYCR